MKTNEKPVETNTNDEKPTKPMKPCTKQHVAESR